MASGLGGWFVRHLKSILHWVLVAVAIGYIGWQLPELIGSIRQAGPVLASMDIPLMIVGAVLATGSLVLYGELHRQLLALGGSTIRGRTVQAITFSENAIASTIPVVGGAGALAYSITRLRAHGVDVALASWAVFLPSALTTVILLIGAVLIVGAAGWMPIWVALAVSVAITLGAMGLWGVATHAPLLRKVMLGTVELVRRIPVLCRVCRGGWAQDPEGTATELASRISLLHPSRGRWVVLTIVALFSWFGDYFALHAVADAMGLQVSSITLAVGFLAVQLSIALQVMPGGAGLAETGLLGVLLSAGAPPGPAAATVLMYRLFTWLGLSVAGWIVYATQIHLTPRHHHGEHEAAEEELPPGTVASH